MATHHYAAILSLLTATHTLPAQDTGQDTSQLAAALGVTLDELEAAESPTAAGRRRVAELTSGDPEKLAGARLFTATFRAQRPPARGKLVICRLPIRGGGAELVAAVDTKGALRGVALLEQEADPTVRRFLAQFRGRKMPHATDATTVRAFEERRAAAARGTDDDAKLTAALLRQRTHMVSILEPFMVFIERWQREQKVADSELAQVISKFETYAELAAPLAPLLGSSAPEYSVLARRAATEFAEFAELAAAGKDPMPVIIRSRQTCTSCHRLEVAGHTTRLQDTAKQLRSERGVGDGYFVLDHDVFAAGIPRDRAQALATELRRAVLLIDLHLNAR